MVRRASFPALFCIAAALSLGQTALAQASGGSNRPTAANGSSFRVEPAPSFAPNEAFGPGTQVTVYPASAFQPADSSYQYNNDFGDVITPQAGGEQRWHLPLALPNGAFVQEVDIFVVDNDQTDITVYVSSAAFPVSGSGTCGSGYWTTATSTGITGQGVVAITNPYGFTLYSRGLCNSVDSYISYFVDVYLEGTNHALSGARVVWNRVVSPAPVTATFGDVPTSHPFFQFVEALVASGITAGCQASPPLYCPDAPLTRKQMAAFLAKALGLYWPQ